MPKLTITTTTGRVLGTLPGVLAPVVLTSVATTISPSPSNILTVASTAGVFPGMSIRAANIPEGAIVHAVISATQLELWRTAWNPTTGVMTHSAANAQATGSSSGGTARALGFDPRALVMSTYLDGTWVNSHRLNNTVTSATSSSGTSPGSLLGTAPAGEGAIIVPTAVTIAAGRATMTEARIAATDQLAATPLKRHDGTPHTSLVVVHTGGMLSVIHEPHTKDITYAGEDS